MQPVTPMDAAFLYFETPTMHMHVVGVLVLDPKGVPGGIDTEDVRAMLGDRIHLVPPFRRRVLMSPDGLGRPVWIEDPDFDLADHVVTAPLRAPITWPGLEQFVGEVAGRPLERSRPLWEIWVVEGLEDGTVALVSKLHHSIMDGGAGGDLMASLFDLQPAAAPPVPEETPWTPDAVPSPVRREGRSLRSLPRLVWEAPAALSGSTRSLVGTASTWLRLRATGQGTSLTAPRTMLNGAITAHRCVSLTRVPLDDVLEIRRAFSTTVNDVVLAATATALRRYLSERHASVDRPLVAAVPVNVRGDGGSRQGNTQLSNMMVPLVLEPEDPVERLSAVHAQALSSKVLQSAFGPESLRLLAGFLAPAVAGAAARLYCGLRLARLHPPVMNLIVSNVPGPPVDLYCAGARVTGIFPMGPVFEGAGLNLTVLSEANHLDVGIMACPELVPDVAELGAGFVAAVAELMRRARSETATSQAPATG